MGAAGMRSAVLPVRACLDVARVRFLVRLWVCSKSPVEALFDGHGGVLQSRKRWCVQPFLPELHIDLAARSGISPARSG